MVPQSNISNLSALLPPFEPDELSMMEGSPLVSGPENTLLSVLLLIIACVGLVGNVLNFLVLYTYHTSHISCGSECTARVNLLGLAVADFFVCLTSLPLAYVQRRHSSKNFMLFYSMIGPGLATYFLTVSVWMVMLISVVRYLAVCRPLRSRACLTSQNMFRIITGIYVVALVIHIPSFLMHTYSETPTGNFVGIFSDNQTEIPFALISTVSSATDTNVTDVNADGPCFFIHERDFWSDQTTHIVYYLIQIILANIGPFIVVVVSNVAVIQACKRSDACRQSLTRETSARRQDVQTANENMDFTTPCSHPFSNRPRVFTLPTQRATLPRSVVLTATNPNYRLPIPHIQKRATNRVTSLLLTVIFAFLLFTAPFGIVHFVCLQVMREMGARIRYDVDTRKLYFSLNMTVEWTNATQLLGCASNFFLYFLVSTTFRRTTKRTFQHIYSSIRNCHTELITSLFKRRSSRSGGSWDNDIRINELRRELDQKLFQDRVHVPSHGRDNGGGKRTAASSLHRIFRHRLHRSHNDNDCTERGNQYIGNRYPMLSGDQDIVHSCVFSHIPQNSSCISRPATCPHSFDCCGSHLLRSADDNTDSYFQNTVGYASYSYLNRKPGCYQLRANLTGCCHDFRPMEKLNIHSNQQTEHSLTDDVQTAHTT